MMDRPQLLLIPGLAVNAAVWRQQIDALSDIADCWVAPLPPYDDLGEIAEFILADAPDQFAVAGFSMGGYLCFEIVRRAPERVLRLALLGTSADPETPEVTERRMFMMQRVEQRGHLATWREHFPRFLHPDRSADRTILDILLKQAYETGPEVSLQHHRAMIKRAGYLDMLPEITCPTLIVVGRQDPVTPIAVQETMARTIPGAELLVLEHCGHVLPLERPRAVSAAMRHWLTREVESAAA